MYSPSPPVSSARGDSYNGSPDHPQGPPRKRMRKGTKSCLECRRRKIKCTFEDNRPVVCNECYARGSTCIDQEHGDLPPSAVVSSSADQSYSLRERVSQLEGLVREVLNRLPESQSSYHTSSSSESQGDTQAAAEALKNLKTSIAGPALESGLSLPGGRHEDAPVLSLFNNAVIARKDEETQITAHQHNKSKKLIQELLRLLPSPRDLEAILDASNEWWTIWRNMFPFITDSRCSTLKESVSHSLRSEVPAEVAKVILCIAISIDQLPTDFDKKRLRLSCPARELMETYINVVDQLIASDDEIAATLDGIECMILEAKYHINLGRPRRAWLLFRRAIGFSQLLGLHRIGNHPLGDDRELRRQQQIWLHLFQGDRYLALILGLPCSIPERFCTVNIPEDTSSIRSGELYLLRASPLVGKIADRNQDPTNMSFAGTLRIDAELDEVAHSLPAEWWNAVADPTVSKEDFFDSIIAKFFHHQIRTLIHLPFMLKSSTDKRYQYSLQAALESSREMIRYFALLRDKNAVGPFVCKLVDFQAFTAATLLILNLIGSSSNSKAGLSNASLGDDQAGQEQDARDWALVDETIACLQRGSTEAGGIVASQSAKALELLSSVRDRQNDCEEDPNGGCQLSIPYFGKITIGPGSKFQQPKKPQKSLTGTTATGIPSAQYANQLPTPPSSTRTFPCASVCGSSAQPSPSSAAGQSFSTPNAMSKSTEQPRGYFGGAEDHLISFDSFMGLPQTDFNVFQPSAPATMGQSYGPDGSANGMDNTAMSLNNANPWPYANSSMGTMDLDQGWDWVGNGAFAAEWNSSINGLTGAGTNFP